MADLTAHDIADLFPPMSEEAYQALKDDIAQHGLRQPVTKWRGVTVDGRGRMRAMRELRIRYRGRTIPDDADVDEVLDLVLSANAMRRDMNASQRAIVAGRCKEHYAEPARLRRLSNLPQYADCKTSYTRGEEGPALAILARKFGVNQDYIARAARLLEEAPDLAAEVEEGSKSIMGAWRELEARIGPKPKRHARHRRKRPEPKRDPLAPPPPPVLPDIPGEIATLTVERLYELYAQGELSEPEEVADRLLAERRRALEAGEPPDERGWASVQMLKHDVPAVEAHYQEGAGTTLEGAVVERPPLPEPVPEPMDDLLALALRLGAILAVRVLTAKRAAPAAPENPWGRQWRVVSEAEWEAAAAPDHDPKAALVRTRRPRARSLRARA